MFSNGILQLGGEREPVPRGKKWPLGPFLAPDAQFIPDISVMDEPGHLEHSDLNAVEVCLDGLRAILYTVISQSQLITLHILHNRMMFSGLKLREAEKE